MENERKFKDGITPFKSLIFMSLQRRVECGIFTSLSTISFSSYSFLSFSSFSFLNFSSTFRSPLSLISFSNFFLSSCSLCFWNALSLFSHKSMSHRFLYLAAQRRNYGSLSMKFRPLSTSSLNSRLSAWFLSKLVKTNCRHMHALNSSQFRMTYFDQCEPDSVLNNTT